MSILTNTDMNLIHGLMTGLTAEKNWYDFIPMLKISDNTYGLYDLVHDVFYPNIGTGTFIGGDVIDGKRVINTYIKIDDAWEILKSGSYIE